MRRGAVDSFLSCHKGQTRHGRRGYLLPMDEKLTLHDGNSIPRLGLGVFQATDGDEITAVSHALKSGYRHIDTAAMYGNEKGVGQAIADSGVPREEIFITTKVWNERIRNGETSASIDESLEKLGVDSVDLMLLHWPVDGRVQAWQELVAARKDGRVKSIGVSNFIPEHLDELVASSDVKPVINQVEYHPWHEPHDIITSSAKHGIAVEAWSPLMRGRLVEEPVLVDIAAELGRTEAQVALRWMLQKDVVVIPKSVTPSRIESNAQLFDFELSSNVMERIDNIEGQGRIGPDPASFDF